MPENPKPSAQPKVKRAWWRRLLRGTGWTLLALFVLHWPLIIFGGPVVARILARRQHIDVRVELWGTLWTNLTVTNLRATPIGTGETPVESIEIQRLRFDYSLWRLIRRGVGEFLSSYEVHQADLRFVALRSKTDEEKETKKSVVETLRTILAQPAAYSDRVLIDDFSIRVRSPEAETVVKSVHVLFDPLKTGYMRIERLQIPGVPVWENITAETIYQNRNLIQRGMRLGPHIVVDEIRYDASRRAEGRGEVAIKSHAFGGELSLTLTGQEKKEEGKHLPKAYDTHLQVAAAGVRVREAAEYFGKKGVPIEKLDSFALDFTGDPEKPRTWAGTIRTVIANLSAGSVAIPRFEISSRFANGTANTTAGVRLGANTVQLDSRVVLPERVDDWLASSVDATAHVDVTDLPALTGAFAPETNATGTAELDAAIKLHERRVSIDAKFNLRELAMKNVVATTATGVFRANTVIRPDNSITPSDLDLLADLQFGTIRVNTFAIDSASLELAVVEGNATLQHLNIVRGGNTITAAGRAKLPSDLAKLSEAAGELQATIKAPLLSEFGITVKSATLGGALEADARMQFAESKARGDVRLDGDVALGDFRTKGIAARLRLLGDTAQLEQLSVGLSDKDRLEIAGQLQTTEPQQYEASLQLGIRNLAILQPLLDVFEVKEPVAGALNVKWKGKGMLKPARHEGDAGVDLRGAKYGTTVVDEIELGGSYTADTADGQLRVLAGPTQFKTRIVYAENRVGLRDIELRQAQQQVLTGEITYSLERAPDVKFDPMRQPFSIRLNADKLDLDDLLSSIKKPAAASGRLSMRLAAQGTPLRPEVELAVEGRHLKAAAAPQFDTAELDLVLNYIPGSLKLDANVRQPLVKPISVKAKIPLDFERVVAEKKLDPNLPLDVTVELPPTSLAVLPKLTPQVLRANGTVELDLKAAGTVQRPLLSGAASISLQNARMTNENIPAIGRFDARMVFAQETLRFERFRGEIGGGTFELLGKMGLDDLKNPDFDLRLKADQVLVKRDDSITVRTDADVAVGGELKAGTVTGTVYVTQSRFFKEIDILPIGLPGRPKLESRPAPKSAPGGPANITLPPPLDAWKFDLKILTREDDPFLVRGNLANGRVALNLRLAGDGKEPYLEGAATIEQFTGSLPFSTITVENGRVYFTRQQPFEPLLDLRAQSKTREYIVTAHVYGNAREPQLQLSSEPPLAHADIVSLLATGTTTGELSGSADVLASRAAIYAVESIWRKITKKKALPKEERPRDDASFRDRFDVDFGGMDQKTGAREATARFKINDQTYILGEFDTGGRFSGSLKYLLRFR